MTVNLTGFLQEQQWEIWTNTLSSKVGEKAIKQKKTDTMYSRGIQGIKLNNILIYEVPGSGTTETTSIKTTRDVDNSGLFL